MQRIINKILCTFGIPRFHHSRLTYLDPHDGFSQLGKSLSEGEKEIQNLVFTSNYEGVWIYSHDNQIWYNIGGKKEEVFRSAKHDGESSVSSPVFNLDKLGNIVTHYHFHPQAIGNRDFHSIEQMIINPLKDSFSEDNLNLLKEGYLKTVHVGMALPSVDDIKAYFRYKEVSPGCDISYKIASPLGITSIKIGQDTNVEEVLSQYPNLHSTAAINLLYANTDLSPMENALAIIKHNLEDRLDISIQLK